MKLNGWNQRGRGEMAPHPTQKTDAVARVTERDDGGRTRISPSL